jgi:ADP-heptose:LPS heptosyltransferase
MLGGLVRPNASLPPPDWSTGPHRVLYLRYDRIGDMVLATGIIKAIVSAQPTVTVDVLASVANAAVLRGNPHVGTVLTIDRKRPLSYLATLARVRRARYDAVVDAMVMAPSLTTMLLMWASGARHRIGVAERGNDFALTLPVARVSGAEHYVDHSAAVLAAFGVDPVREARQRAARPPASPGAEPGSGARIRSSPNTSWGIWQPELFLTPAELKEGEARWREARGHASSGATGAGRLIVNVSAGAGWRYWPDERFIATLGRIWSRFPDWSILLVGAPEDKERMARIGAASGVSVRHTAHYREMMALVATADVALTADTSVTHIASAFGTPAVVMFARSRDGLYGPYGTAGRAVSTTSLSLESLQVGPVVEALESVVAAARPSR